MKRSRSQQGFSLTDFKGEIIWETSKPDGQPRRRLDTSRAKAQFGFEARVPFGDGLSQTVNWFRGMTKAATPKPASRGSMISPLNV